MSLSCINSLHMLAVASDFFKLHRHFYCKALLLSLNGPVLQQLFIAHYSRRPSKELKEGRGLMGRAQTSETSGFTRVSFASVVAVHRGVL